MPTIYRSYKAVFKSVEAVSQQGDYRIHVWISEVMEWYDPLQEKKGGATKVKVPEIGK